MKELQPPTTTDEPVVQEKRGWGSRISRIIWDRDNKSEEERKFVQKLDIGLMTIMCLGYFIKYLDQSNISNAYVSGMKEDLNFTGDEYNVLLTCFVCGYVIGQFPATLLMLKVSPAIWLPSCEIFWTVLVMLCSVAKKPEHLMVLRFFIGLAEASAYPGGLWVLGSWYNKHELGKRAVLFICASSAGTMFSGYLQTAVLRLSNVGGLTGWQWLFIMDGVISLPIATAGYFLIPNSPDRPNPRAKWLSPADYAYGRARMEKIGRRPQQGFTVSTFVGAAKSWVPWSFFLPYAGYVLGLSSFAYMNLWLKASGLYTTAQINLIPTGGYGSQIVAALLYSWASDAMGKRWPVIAFGGSVALIGNIILAVWPVNDQLKFAGFFLAFQVTPTGALTLAWANELTSMNAEHRAITLGFLNTASYVFNAWVPNLVFPASKAPHYPVGYKATSAFFAIYVIGILLIALKVRSEDKKPALEDKEETESNDEKIGSEVEPRV